MKVVCLYVSEGGGGGGGHGPRIYTLKKKKKKKGSLAVPHVEPLISKWF